MKRLQAFVVLAAVLSLLFAANIAMADDDHHRRGHGKMHRLIDLDGTKWTGTVTYVDNASATTKIEDFTIKFDTQDKFFFSGTMTDLDGGPDAVGFSGVVNPLDAKSLLITGAGVTIFADIEKRHGKKILVIRISDTANDRTFLGVLKKGCKRDREDDDD